MKALRILLVAAMTLMMVSGAFGEVDWMNGEAEYSVEFQSVEVGDADAVTDIMLGDGGRISFEPSASKELDNGATVSVETRLDIKYDEISDDYFRLKYMNGPLTVQMLKAARPGPMDKGKDVYVPQDPLYNVEWTSERDISFAYAGESMTFTTTLNWRGDETVTYAVVDLETGESVDTDFTANNTIAVHPAIEMGLGAATLLVAAEYYGTFPQNTDADGPSIANFGGGAGIKTTLGAMTVGASAAYGVKGGSNPDGDDLDAINQMSAYAFMTMAVGEAGEFGLAGGYNMESIDDVDDDLTGYQVNVAFSQDNVMVPGLKFEAGAGYSSVEDHSKTETTKTGGVAKLIYGF